MDILKSPSNVIVTDGNVFVTGRVIEMTNTVDVLKEVLNHKWSLKILESLGEGEMTFTSLKRALSASHNPQVSRAVANLDRLALVDHVFTEAGDFYRISARGKRILEIVRGIEKEQLEVVH
ncbi:MAG: winged helix-turn-helix transcriptional regulator [Candidatus Thorarchaeota archaeon]